MLKGKQFFTFTFTKPWSNHLHPRPYYYNFSHRKQNNCS